MMIKSAGHWFINMDFAQGYFGPYQELFQISNRTGKNLFGEEIELPSMQIQDGIAVIPIKGVLLNGAPAFAKALGFVDYKDIQQELMVAEESAEVSKVVLDMDCPGGTANGCPETSSMISSMSKPVYSFTDSLMASAAYYLAVAGNGVIATPSALVGSIGSVKTHYDVSEMFSKMGIKVETFASGSLKGMGTPGVPLTEEQREFLQNEVNQHGQAFKDHVIANRGEVDPALMEGQTFTGSDAVDNGLIDGLASHELDFYQSLIELA